MGLLTSRRSSGGSVPLLPASLTEPLWVQFAALLDEGDRPQFAPDHPWVSPAQGPRPGGVRSCARRPDPRQRIRAGIATVGCSDRPVRHRLADLAGRGVGEEVLKAALAAYDRMIGLDLDDVSVDGSITKSRAAENFPVGPRWTAASKARNGRWPSCDYRLKISGRHQSGSRTTVRLSARVAQACAAVPSTTFHGR